MSNKTKVAVKDMTFEDFVECILERKLTKQDRKKLEMLRQIGDPKYKEMKDIYEKVVERAKEENV